MTLTLGSGRRRRLGCRRRDGVIDGVKMNLTYDLVYGSALFGRVGYS